MSFTFRQAVRENVPLLVGLAGGTGSGKTYSALRLARGMAGEKPFAVIDTENGRANVYADEFRFDHGELAAPFSPERYLEAITAADKAGYPVIVVDSASHEWAGEGGCLDMQEAELERMAGSDYGKRERVKMAAWIKPKSEHKRMVQRLLQVRAHLILCFRAEPKVEMVRKDGRLEVQAKQSLIGKDGWIPIVEKNLPFEMVAYFLLLASAPGVPEPITLRRPHRDIFPAKQEITEECGRQIAEWARGGAPKPAPQQPQGPSPTPPSSELPAPTAAAAGPYITENQRLDLETLCNDKKVPLDKLRKVARVDALEHILAADYADAVKWIGKQRAA